MKLPASQPEVLTGLIKMFENGITWNRRCAYRFWLFLASIQLPARRPMMMETIHSRQRLYSWPSEDIKKIRKFSLPHSSASWAVNILAVNIRSFAFDTPNNRTAR